MSQFNPKKLNIEAIHAGQRYPDTRSAFLPSDVNEIIESLYGISLGVENSAKRAFILSTPGNLIDISAVNKNIYFPKGTTIYTDGYEDIFAEDKYVEFDRSVQLSKRGIVLYNKKTKFISIIPYGFNSGSTYEVLYLFSFAYDSENNLVTDLPVEHLVNGEKQSSDRAIVKETYNVGLAYINIDTKSYDIAIPEGTFFGNNIVFNEDVTYNYGENVENEEGYLYDIAIVYDRTEELIKSIYLYELHEHRNYAWLFTIRMDADKFVYCDLEAPFYVDGKLNDEQISEEITQELDRQKIALANLEYFVPNENVLTDNSAKYRKPIPENACPYAEVKKVGGLTQRSKNLIPYPYNFTSPLTVLGVTWTANANGSITANGTQTTSGSVPLFVYNNNPIFFNGTYSASLGVALPKGCTLYLHFLDDLGNVNIIDGAENGTKTISNRKCDGIRFWIASGTVFNNVTFFPMLNEGSVALPYAQYFDGWKDAFVTSLEIVNESKDVLDTITIPEQIQALEGYGIGKSESENNYIDFEKKVFHKEYGKIRLLSTMGGYVADSNWYAINCSSYLGVSPVTRNVVCNALPSVDIIVKTEADGIYVNPSFTHIILRKSEFTTQAEYRQWLADNEVYIVEKLATPVVTDVSQYLTEDNIINVEDGVFINAVNANELDAPTTVTYLLKQADKVSRIKPTSGYNCVYTENTDGTQGSVKIDVGGVGAYTMAQRDSMGCVRTGMPQVDTHSVPLKYANEHYVQITPNNSGIMQALVQNTDGTTAKVGINTSATDYTIARRYTDGRLKVAPPVLAEDAVPLAFAKANFAPLKTEYKLITWSTDVQGKTYKLEKDIKYLLYVDVDDVSDGKLVYDEYADGLRSVVNWGADFFTYEGYNNNYEEDGYYEGIVLKPKFKSEQVVFSIEHPPCYVGMDYVVVKQR